MLIPKVIHKIILTDDNKIPQFPQGLKDALETFYRMNPGYQVKMYSGDMCEKYILDHFDEETLRYYKTLKPYSYRCDFMRHLILWNEGGWYSDIRQKCLIPLEHLGKTGHEYYTSTDCPPNQMCMYTAFIGSVPKHPISKKMIDIMKFNIDQRHYGLDCLYPTGPGAYIQACIDYVRFNQTKCLVGKHTGGDEHVVFGDTPVVKCKYNNAQGADNSDVKGTNHYGKMWLERNIYN